MKKILFFAFILIQQTVSAQFVFEIVEIKKVTRAKDDWISTPVEIKNEKEIHMDDSTITVVRKIKDRKKTFVYTYGGESDVSKHDTHTSMFWYARNQKKKRIGFYLKTTPDEYAFFTFLKNYAGDGIEYKCRLLKAPENND